MIAVGRDREHMRAVLARGIFEGVGLAEWIADPEDRTAPLGSGVEIAIGVPHDAMRTRAIAQIDACHLRQIGRAEHIHTLSAIAGKRDMRRIGRSRQFVRIGAAIDRDRYRAAGEIDLRQGVAELACDEQRARYACLLRRCERVLAPRDGRTGDRQRQGE